MDGDKNLVSIFHQLFAANLITENELENSKDKSAHMQKAEIFDLMVKNDLVIGTRMLSVVKSTLDELQDFDKQSRSPGVSEERASCHNPLQIDTVILEVYRFLSLKDIKNCRLVCQKWDFVAESLLKKRVMVNFGPRSVRLAANGSEKMYKFLEDFSPFKSKLSLENFRFSGKTWSITWVSKFFQEYGKNVDQLIWDSMFLQNEKGIKLNDLDISHWLLDTKITKLSVDCSSGTKVSLRLDKFPSIDDLSLTNCNIVIVENARRIDLSRIKLHNVVFFEHEKEREACRFNDYIDFSKTKRIDLLWNRKKTSCPAVDLAEAVNLDSLALGGIILENWPLSKNSSKELKMYNNLLEKTNKNIKEFDFSCIVLPLDLFTLPDTLEKLHIAHVGHSSVLCSGPINLPNLKYLYVRKAKELHFLSHFANCVNLTDVEIGKNSAFAQKLIVNLDQLPRSVKNLKIEGREIITGSISLDTLILNNCPLANVFNILLKNTPEILIVRLSHSLEDKIANTNDLIVQIIQFRSHPTFIGPLDWQKLEVESGSLRLGYYIDRQASYYRFEDQWGIAMSCSDFEKLARKAD